MNREEILKKYKVEDVFIMSPGPYEGAHFWGPYFYKLVEEGCRRIVSACAVCIAARHCEVKKPRRNRTPAECPLGALWCAKVPVMDAAYLEFPELKGDGEEIPDIAYVYIVNYDNGVIGVIEEEKE